MSCFEPLTNRLTNAIRIARGRVGHAYQYVRQRLRRRRPRVGVDPQGTHPPVRPQQGRLSKFKDELSNKRTLKKAGLQTVGKPQEGASGTAWELVDKDARPKTAMPKRLGRPPSAIKKGAEEFKRREEAAIERRREAMLQQAAAIRRKLGKAADVPRVKAVRIATRQEAALEAYNKKHENAARRHQELSDKNKEALAKKDMKRQQILQRKSDRENPAAKTVSSSSSSDDDDDDDGEEDEGPLGASAILKPAFVPFQGEQYSSDEDEAVPSPASHLGRGTLPYQGALAVPPPRRNLPARLPRLEYPSYSSAAAPLTSVVTSSQNGGIDYPWSLSDLLQTGQPEARIIHVRQSSNCADAKPDDNTHASADSAPGRDGSFTMPRP